MGYFHLRISLYKSQKFRTCNFNVYFLRNIVSDQIAAVLYIDYGSIDNNIDVTKIASHSVHCVVSPSCGGETLGSGGTPGGSETVGATGHLQGSRWPVRLRSCDQCQQWQGVQISKWSDRVRGQTCRHPSQTSWSMFHDVRSPGHSQHRSAQVGRYSWEQRWQGRAGVLRWWSWVRHQQFNFETLETRSSESHQIHADFECQDQSQEQQVSRNQTIIKKTQEMSLLEVQVVPLPFN